MATSELPPAACQASVSHTASARATGSRGSAVDIYTFFGLAFAISWLSGLPLALAWIKQVPPAPYAIGLSGLGALGPTIAAFAVAAPRGQLREVFGRWRTNPGWILLALLVLPGLHLLATLLYVAFGGEPTQWFYPPVRPEHFAALVMFSVFEEFGWRGFAYPRLQEQHGPVKGSLILGVGWAIWHLAMLVSPETGSFEWFKLGIFLVDLPLYSVVFAWVFERGNRSMAVAIALHAGAHLDNIYRLPDADLRLWLARFLVLLVVAVMAARSLLAQGKDGKATRNAVRP